MGNRSHIDWIVEIDNWDKLYEENEKWRKQRFMPITYSFIRKAKELILFLKERNIPILFLAPNFPDGIALEILMKEDHFIFEIRTGDLIHFRHLIKGKAKGFNTYTTESPEEIFKHLLKK